MCNHFTTNFLKTIIDQGIEIIAATFSKNWAHNLLKMLFYLNACMMQFCKENAHDVNYGFLVSTLGRIIIMSTNFLYAEFLICSRS